MNDIGASTLGLDPIARAREVGPFIAEAADEIERIQDIPAPLLNRIIEARLPRMLLPRSAGGDEVEPWIYMRAIEELARHDGSVGWNLFVANSAALIAPFIPLSAARKIYGDIRGWIAWGPPNQYTCEAVPGGYRVSGEWHFASGSRQATWMGAHCNVVEPDGSLRLNRFGRPTFKTLLYPKSQRTPIEDWNTLGMRGTASEGYRLENVFIPEEFTGTREDPALRRDPGPLYAFTMQGLYSVGVAGVAMGIARAMLDEFITLAKEKTPRGLARLADMPVVQSDVAHREAALGSGRAFLTEILKDVWANAGDIEPIDTAARVRVRLGCAQAIKSAIETADYVYKAAGVSAIFKGTPFERRFRDMHTLSQQIQSRDSHFETVGKIMFNGDPDGLFL
ncbi:MAG: acyl-CoA dehydrogenase [Acetobacteraceae bacterium]|nr:acyl-CoA dehydrogenase [Acetobacteraceae bacterium]